ncbi:MAG: PD-(D/E)XK nuclease family protein [Elusimicrobia bacterium]|nr:PD-(D/E)XK nuclease family protein [Elusimicrobiota bacterium]
MKINIIGPRENLVEKAGGILLADKSLADNIVVFPGKRPAHFLRKYLADKLGAAFEPPVIFSMDGFIDHLAELAQIKGTELSNLDAVGILYDNMLGDLAGIIGKTGNLSLDTFLPWGFKIFSDFEELKIELKTPKELKDFDSILPGEIKGSDSFIKKLKSFSGVYEQFYTRLEKEKLLTRSLKYAKTAEKIQETGLGNKKIILAGFFALTASEKKIFKALARLPDSILLLQEGPGLKEQFTFLESSLQAYQPTSSPACQPALHFYKAPDLHGEVFKLANILKGQTLTSKDVVVLPSSDALFPVLFNVLGEVRDYNISMGYPVTATPVYSLIDSLGDLLEKRSGDQYFAPNYLKFVFHPYVKNIYFQVTGHKSQVTSEREQDTGDRSQVTGNRSSEPTRIIFQTIETELASKINKYLTLEDIETDTALLAQCADLLKNYADAQLTVKEIQAHIKNIHKNLIRPFEKLESIKDFADKLIAVVSFISEHSTANLHPYSAPFIEKLYEDLHAFSNSALSGRGLENISSYFKLLKSYIKGSAYPFPGTPLSGLQVLGALETRGLKFDRVYFLDANADILPGSKKEDTILSHFIRRGLGLPTYKTRESVAKYYFNVLISQAEEAHIFYKDAPDIEKSPFVQKLIWDLEVAGQKPKEEEVHFRLNFTQQEPPPVAKAEDVLAYLKNFTFSPSSLDAYLACGLKFYYQYVLRVKEKDEVEDEIGQAEIGGIVHGILERLFREHKQGEELKLTRATEIAEEIFDAGLKNHDSGYEYLIKKQILRRLRDILLYHKENAGKAQIKSCEKIFDITLDGVKFTGRADRIDLRPDEKGRNAHIIVDYKTGSTAKTPNLKKFDIEDRQSWPKTLKSVQLPLYVMFYLAENPYVALEAVDACLMMLGSHKITEEFLFAKSEDKAADLAKLQKAVSYLVYEIKSPELNFEPASDIKTCELCPFKIMCGRQWA